MNAHRWSSSSPCCPPPPPTTIAVPQNLFLLQIPVKVAGGWLGQHTSSEVGEKSHPPIHSGVSSICEDEVLGGVVGVASRALKGDPHHFAVELRATAAPVEKYWTGACVHGKC